MPGRVTSTRPLPTLGNILENTQPGRAADPGGAGKRPARARGGFISGFLAIAGPYWTSAEERWRAWGLAAALAALGTVQVLIAIWLNSWMAALFDALEERSTPALLAQIPPFVAIVLGTMSADAAHLEAKRRLQLGWRQWLTVRLLDHWLEDGRQYQTGLLPGDHANPDGRIAEDARIATEYAVDLATTLFFCVLLLGSFLGILWSLSGEVEIAGFSVPGHMVWLALLYAMLGSTVAFVLGRSLVRATDERQGAEADFRFGLVTVREDAERVALAGAEARERGRLSAVFVAVSTAWRRQTGGLRQILIFSSGYTVLAPVLPILVSAPRYLAETISLGGLMQTAQAFQQVAAALAWPVDNFALIAAWRASVERVLALEQAVFRIPQPDAPGTLRRTVGTHLALQDLTVHDPAGKIVLPGINLDVRAGERVCITGDPAVASAAFTAMAGIWRWGNGTILLPTESIAFASQRPYLPTGPLRHVLAFPFATRTTSNEEDARMAEALRHAGLPWLAEMLDEALAWHRVLGPQDQQRLAAARLLLARPRWIVLHDAFDALDPEAKLTLLRQLADAADVTVLMFGRDPGPSGFYNRCLRLERETGQLVPMPEA